MEMGAFARKITFSILPDLYTFIFPESGDIHYIGGTDVLPPPLSSEEESCQIEMLASPLADEAKKILIEHNLRLVVYIAKKIDNTGVGVEDLISIGTIGVIKAISRLSGREKTIMKMRFGIGTPEGEEKTQKEVADLLGISQSYISRLEKKIMLRLKKELVKYS